MIAFEIYENKLLALYEPEWPADRYIESLRERIKTDKGVIIKKIFWVSKEFDKYTSNYYNERLFVFEIGRLSGDYFKLNKNVFGIEHNIYFSKDIRFDIKLFMAYRNISIISKIDDVITDDVYIISKTIDTNQKFHNVIPLEVYKLLVKSFPNTTELNKYAEARISNILLNYCDGLGNKNEEYENYLNKRDIKPISRKIINFRLQLELFEQARKRLEDMLKNYKGYSEYEWQERILEIILILYPKYICAKREVKLGTDGRHSKIPDFLLVDTYGFVDVLEIKKPKDIKVMTPTQYRNNYVPDREFSGAITQLEKYIYCLNAGGKLLEDKITSTLSSELPPKIKIRINNSKGILLMGRSTEMNQEQIFDFEIIKRQYNNVVDVMTYDDLIERLKNIISFFSRQK